MKSKPWSATIDISLDTVAKVVSSQFPNLPVRAVHYLGEGWDNKVFLVNDLYVFRFPRRTEGVTLMAHEIRVMPLLAAHIDLPIAHPRFIGYPTDDFPYPFAGYDFFEGVALAEVDFSTLPETEVLPQLAQFLRKLHHLDLSKIPTDITEDIGRMDYKPRVIAIKDGLEQLNQAGHAVKSISLMGKVAACASYFPAENTCIVHGDLHPRHILIKNNKISGIIDWGDMSFGCKAIDLSILYTLYHPQHHDMFWAIYGDVSYAIKQQALFRSIYSNVILGLYALDMNYPLLLRSALQGLENCSEN